MYQSFLGRINSGLLKLVDVTAAEFGAVGDGCVDDTAAIQRAVFYAVDHAPATVFFPRGIYMVQDPTTDTTGTGEDFGPIRIPSSARDVTLWGEGATIKVGPNGVTMATVRVFGARCRVMHLIVDCNGDVALRTKRNSAFEINGSNNFGVYGTDNQMLFLKAVNGLKSKVQTVTIAGSPSSGYYTLSYNGNATGQILWNAGEDDVESALRLVPGLSAVTVSTTGPSPNVTHTVTFNGYIPDTYGLVAASFLNQGSVTVADVVPGIEDHFLETNGTRNVWFGCQSYDSNWNGFRQSVNGSRFEQCSAFGQRGNGFRVNGGTELWISDFTCESDRNSGRSCILVDPGSQSPTRRTFVWIDRARLYCGANGIPEGGAAVLKVAACQECVVTNSTIRAAEGSSGSPNSALRLEDNLRKFTMENCYISPNVILTPGLFQGPVTNNQSDGSSPTPHALLTIGSGHGISAGQSVFVQDSLIPSYNREHLVIDATPTTITTDVPYVAGAIGANCYAHVGVDEVRMRNCIVENFWNDAGVGRTFSFESITCRIFDIENVEIRSRYKDEDGAYVARTEKLAGISWTMNDAGLDLFRMVDCKMQFNSTKICMGVRCSTNRGTNEKQTVTITGQPMGGNYTLFRGADSTGPITYTASPTDQTNMQNALRTLSGLGSVTVSRDATNPNSIVFTISFVDVLADTPQLTNTNALSGGTSPQILHATTQTWTLSTQLLKSGKTIGLRNTIEQWSSGATTLIDPYQEEDTGSAYSDRATLFNSDADSTGAYTGTAAPAKVAVAWNAGDRVRNLNPGAGGRPAYVCVTAGTPGTWQREALLSALP